MEPTLELIIQLIAQGLVVIVPIALIIIGMFRWLRQDLHRGYDQLREDNNHLKAELRTERDERHKLGERVARLEGIQSHRSKDSDAALDTERDEHRKLDERAARLEDSQ